MKKILAWMMVTACILLSLGTINVNKAYADDVTVSGTVISAKQGNVIEFKTSDGTMLLKLDSNSDLSKCKNLMPGRNLVITITYGNDEYWHIKNVKEGANVSTAKVDTSNISTVTGIAKRVDSNNILYFSTSNGEMQIKLDPTTDFSGCTALIGENSYVVKCAYGSDAYMHATAISDGNTSNATTYQTTTSSGASTNVTAEATVTGTIGAKSTSSILVLDTKEGQMQIKLDQYNGPLRILVAGKTCTVGINYGNEYWHAVSIN